jgi:hypothetical protein
MQRPGLMRFALGGGMLTLLALTVPAAEGATIGMVADDATKTAVVFDADSLQVIGSVALGGGTFVGDCDITPDLTTGVVTDYDNHVWLVDLTTSPPQMAAGANPVLTTNPGEDVSVTSDGRHAVVCAESSGGSGSFAPVSVVDLDLRTEVDAFDLQDSCNAVDVCPDGSVLVGSFTTGAVRRFQIDTAGRLADTGDSLALPFVINVHCSADSASGIAIRFSPGRVQSFTLPGLTPVHSRSVTATAGITGGISTDRTKVMARSANGALDIFGYDSPTAGLSTRSETTFAAPTAPAVFGIDQAVLHPDGSRVYVPVPGAINVYSTLDGALVGSITAPEIVAPLGVCVRGQSAACGNGVVESDEVCDDGAGAAAGDGVCMPDCSGRQVCGDGVVAGTELCDGGESNGSGEGSCREDCSGTQSCGDGVAEGTESCDDGDENGVGEGACLDDCSGRQFCGDGVAEGTESCDSGDANGAGEGACLEDCSGVQVCGNGSVEGSEACDDGAVAGSGEGACLLDCSGVQRCGDGRAEGTEACDELGDSAGCDADCTFAVCGDEIVNAAAGEECDAGAANGDTAVHACRADCTLPACGDATLDAGELCEHPVAGVEVCNNLEDDDGDGAIDCMDSDCPSVCSHDPSITCSSDADCHRRSSHSTRSRCAGAVTCSEGCSPVAACTPGAPSAGLVAWARRGDASDVFWLHTVFEPQMPAELDRVAVSLLITNEEGVVYRAELLPGDLQWARRSRAFEFSDDGARIGGGRRGGLGRVVIREHHRRGRTRYGVSLWVYTDLSAVGPGPLAAQIVIGDDSVVVETQWARMRGGMRMRRRP